MASERGCRVCNRADHDDPECRLLGNRRAAEMHDSIESERSLHRQLWERTEEGYIFKRLDVRKGDEGHLYSVTAPDGTLARHGPMDRCIVEPLPSAVRAASEHAEQKGRE